MGSRFYNDNCVNYDRDRSQFLEFMPFLNIHRSDLKLLQRILAIYVQLVHILCDIRNLETRFGSIEWNNIKYISGLLFWGLHNSFTKILQNKHRGKTVPGGQNCPVFWNESAAMHQEAAEGP